MDPTLILFDSETPEQDGKWEIRERYVLSHLIYYEYFSFNHALLRISFVALFNY